MRSVTVKTITPTITLETKTVILSEGELPGQLVPNSRHVEYCKDSCQSDAITKNIRKHLFF